MIRWKYLLPRMAIVLGILLLVSVFADPIMRRLVIHSAQSVTGAKVDIGSIETSPWQGKVILREFQVADPHRPMRNLLQADEAELRVNPMRLLNRQWLIESAKLDHVQFGTPRTQSGALSKSKRPSTPSRPAVDERLQRELNELTRRWLNEVQREMPSVAERKLETVAFSKELQARWPGELEKQKAAAMALKSQAISIERSLMGSWDNPLRDMERFQDAIRQIHELQKQVEAAKSQLHGLGAQFQADRRELIAAKGRDHARILALTETIQLDDRTVSEILLGRRNARQINELIGWIQWFRESLPDPDKDFQPTRGRGIDVPFRQQPAFVFENIALTGEGRIAGQYFHFSGTAKNITTAPKLYPEPAEFELRGQGQAHLHVSAVVDRRGLQRMDDLTISCPRIELPGERLGAAGAISLDVQPSFMNFHAKVTLTDDQIAGTLNLQQTGVKLALQELHAVAGGQRVTDYLRQQMSGIETFEVTIDISGDIDDPSIQLTTDLGSQFVGLMEKAIADSWREQADARLLDLQTLLDQQLVELDRDFSGSLNEILGILDNEIPTVAELEQLNPFAAESRFNRIR